MTEMICCLVVAAVITIAAFRGIVRLKLKYMTSQMTSLVTSLAAEVHTGFAGYGSYEGLNNTRLKDAEMLPSGLKYNKARILYHYEKGRLDVFPLEDMQNSSPSAFFAVRMQNLSSGMCFELASFKWNMEISSGLKAMEVSARSSEKNDLHGFYPGCSGIDADLFAAADKGYALACAGGSRQNFPLMPRYAYKACNCSGKTCMITWIYK